MRLHALPILFLLLAPATGRAATFAVDSTADQLDAMPGDGTCATSGGDCTLRGAIQEANALAGPDEITVPAGTFVLVRNGTEGADAAAEGDLDVEEALTLTGAGPADTIVDGNDEMRVFDVAADATISGLTVRNGQGGSDGGGFLVTGGVSLTLRDAHVTGNQAVHGGGISVFDSGTTVLVERASLAGNTGSTSGGALESDFGDLTLRNVTVSGNVSGQADVVSGGTLALEHVTVRDDVIGGTTSVPAGDVTVDRSILDAGAAGSVCAEGAFTSLGGNVEHGTSCGFAMAGDVSGQDPMLAALADNGGGTLTHAVGAASPAVDRASGCPPPAEDQRGVARPIDGDGDTTTACDAGAFEFDPAAPPTTSTTTSTTLPGGCAATTGFANALCEVDGLAGTLDAGVPAGAVHDKALALVAKARERVQQGEGAGTSRQKRKALARAAKFLKKARGRIAGKAGRKAVPDAAARGTLVAEIDRVRAVVVVLRGLV
jgi:CSLREA domain-containing protein